MARPFKGTTFWDRVYSKIEQIGECVVFTGCKDNCGYGRIRRDSGLVRLHRAVWERDNGNIPLGHIIMHSCDNPACINPEHLILGTQRLNIFDMDKKGRRRTLIGSEQPMAKLTETDIPMIIMRLQNGNTCVSIAKHYGVSEGLIRHIKKGRAWTHVV